MRIGLKKSGRIEEERFRKVKNVEVLVHNHPVSHKLLIDIDLSIYLSTYTATYSVGVLGRRRRCRPPPPPVRWHGCDDGEGSPACRDLCKCPHLGADKAHGAGGWETSELRIMSITYTPVKGTIRYRAGLSLANTPPLLSEHNCRLFRLTVCRLH